jgi:hypothetical protein
MAILFHGTTLWRLSHSLTMPTRGILGLVDDLLAASREHGLKLDWQSGHSRLRFLDGGSADWIDVPLRKSVVRAALARVAVLCNEQNPNSVSPYGGLGELLVGTDPATALRVAFVNTPDEQSLEPVPVSSDGRSVDGQKELKQPAQLPEKDCSVEPLTSKQAQ